MYKNISLHQIALSNVNGKAILFKGNKSGHHSIKRDRGLGSTVVDVRKLVEINGK